MNDEQQAMNDRRCATGDERRPMRKIRAFLTSLPRREDRGRGCPLITAPPGSWHFNANHCNLIIWVVLFAACALSWSFATRGAFSRLTVDRRLILRGIGLYILLFACARHWAKEFWL